MPESVGCIGPTVLPHEKRTPRCARLRGPASFGISGPAADAPRPPALYVAYPVPFVTAQAGTLAPTDAENQGLNLRSQEFVRTVFSQMRVAGIRRSQGRRKIFVRTVFSISFLLAFCLQWEVGFRIIRLVLPFIGRDIQITRVVRW